MWFMDRRPPALGFYDLRLEWNRVSCRVNNAGCGEQAKGGEGPQSEDNLRRRATHIAARTQ